MYNNFGAADRVKIQRDYIIVNNVTPARFEHNIYIIM